MALKIGATRMGGASASHARTAERRPVHRNSTFISSCIRGPLRSLLVHSAHLPPPGTLRSCVLDRLGHWRHTATPNAWRLDLTDRPATGTGPRLSGDRGNDEQGSVCISPTPSLP